MCAYEFHDSCNMTHYFKSTRFRQSCTISYAFSLASDKTNAKTNYVDFALISDEASIAYCQICDCPLEYTWNKSGSSNLGIHEAMWIITDSRNVC